MPKCFSSQLLIRLRNDIPIEPLIAHTLRWPSKRRDGRFCFVCPACRESCTAVNTKTNLGRCFVCERNFNPIDFVMFATDRHFVDAVHYLASLLPEHPPTR